MLVAILFFYYTFDRIALKSKVAVSLLILFENISNIALMDIVFFYCSYELNKIDR